jgi:prepilin-type N-terminal cleavage/methylation domain-containing protein
MSRGFTLVELVVGLALGLVALAILVAAFAAGVRLLVLSGARVEATDAVVIAAESFQFDVRRAGWDPAGASVEPLVDARADRVTLHADLDGDGAVDPSSEEVTSYVCSAGPPRLSRIIGAQSMPVAGDVTACELRYADAAGVPVVPGPDGLSADERRAVRRIALDLGVRSGAITASASRSTTVALRSTP